MVLVFRRWARAQQRFRVREQNLSQFRAVDQYVYDRVLHFLRRRCKVHSRGTAQFSYATVFGELGVLRLRDVALRVTSVC